MKFPVSMLHDFVQTTLSAEELGDLLTMAGFELEGIEEVEGEAVLDIKVVSNRGDGLSVFGLAREVLAKDSGATATNLYRETVIGHLMGDESQPLDPSIASVQIDTEACNRFGARFFAGVSNSESPDWLQQRLRQAGLRPLGVLVDLTNYVMLELGQPLHAYDYDLLAGHKIIVRGANPGEKLTTLNGIEHELKPHHMMICDADRAIGVAGVMGGLDTEVGSSTRNVLLESAHFDANSVRKTRKELGLNTDASYRFERSVDPNGVVRALNRFAMLLKECAGTNGLAPGVIDLYPRPSKSTSVPIRVSRACKLLGMTIETAEAKGYLERLGFAVSGDGEPFQVESPSWRPDIVREEDLVEEIGRIHGYERIPTAAPIGSTPIGGLKGLELARDNAKNAMLRCGFVQAISHSLRDKHPLDSPNLESIGPKNPGSPEMAWLRSSLWPSLADAALRNGAREIHLFEVGRVHGSSNGEFIEGQRLAMLSIGALYPEHWEKSSSPVAGFFSLKGVAETALRAMGKSARFEPSSDDPRLHPTRQAKMVVGEKVVGVIGQIHPIKAEESGLPESTVLAAIDLEAAYASPDRGDLLKSISRNPAIRRDISVQLSKEISYKTAEQAIWSASTSDLEKVWLADVYEGKGIPEGQHSLTFSLQMRRHGENLTDEQANQERDRAVAALEQLGGVRR